MSNKQKVYEYIDNHRDDIVDYLANMVKIPSINYTLDGSEKEVQEWLAESLREFGFDKVDKFAVDEKKERPNVIGVLKGSGGGKSLILNGHMDTVDVPEPDEWKYDPFGAEIQDGKMYGRGTSDMKSGVASAVWAMKALKDCGISVAGDVILQAVIGEESQEAEEFGTVKALERGYDADFAIICEPTSLEVHTASAALFFFELEVYGKDVHTSARNQVMFPQPYGVKSGPEVGVDALHKSLMFIDYFYRLEVEWSHRFRDPIIGGGGYPHRDTQGVGVFNINPSKIEGGVYLGSVPPFVKLLYCVWYPDQMVKKEELFEEIRRGVEALASTDAFLRENPPRLSIPVVQDWGGFQVPVEHPGVQALVKSVEDATEKPAVISAFKAVCDGYYLNEAGTPAIVCGPGAVGYGVHGSNEFVVLDDIIDATKIYASMILNWCGE